MVLIRTDANQSVATGHLMRCLSIAGQLEALGEEVVFLFRDWESAEILADRQVYRMLQGGKGLSVEDELAQIIQILESVGDGAKLLLDSYAFDAAYMATLKPYVCLLYTSDAADELYCV